MNIAVADPSGDDGFGWFSQRGRGTQSGNSPRGWGSWGGQPDSQRGWGSWGAQLDSQRGQTGAQRSGGSLTGPQQGWGSQYGNPGWRDDDRYFRRDQQRW